MQLRTEDQLLRYQGTFFVPYFGYHRPTQGLAGLGLGEDGPRAETFDQTRLDQIATTYKAANAKLEKFTTDLFSG